MSNIPSPVDLMNDLRLVTNGEFREALEKLRAKDEQQYKIVVNFLRAIPRARKRQCPSFETI